MCKQALSQCCHSFPTLSTEATSRYPGKDEGDVAAHRGVKDPGKVPPWWPPQPEASNSV